MSTSARNELQLAIAQIEAARNYTKTLLDDLPDELWFRTPSVPTSGSPVTHIAWQVGHLAMAQYMLAAVRMRGKRPEDEQVISKSFLRLFLKGSTPTDETARYPSPEEIRHTLDAVHELVMSELPNYSADTLAEPAPAPYMVEATKLGSLFFCASHEMLHAGQIGLLRRLLGLAPLR